MHRQRGIQWLYGELPTLLSEGVLSTETATRLQQYYGPVQVRSRRALVLLVCAGKPVREFVQQEAGSR